MARASLLLDAAKTYISFILILDRSRGIVRVEAPHSLLQLMSEDAAFGRIVLEELDG
jgi:hypothetical protein